MLCYMICKVDGSIYVLNGKHRTETCLKIQNRPLADGQELGDWQEYTYVKILKYTTPWRIGQKVAGLQPSGSQSATWTPVYEALNNMLLYIQDRNRERER